MYCTINEVSVCSGILQINAGLHLLLHVIQGKIKIMLCILNPLL